MQKVGEQYIGVENYFSSVFHLIRHGVVDFKIEQGLRLKSRNIALTHHWKLAFPRLVGSEWRSQGPITTWPSMAENLGLPSAGTSWPPYPPFPLASG